MLWISTKCNWENVFLHFSHIFFNSLPISFVLLHSFVLSFLFHFFFVKRKKINWPELTNLYTWEKLETWGKWIKLYASYSSVRIMCQCDEKWLSHVYVLYIYKTLYTHVRTHAHPFIELVEKQELIFLQQVLYVQMHLCHCIQQ